MGDPLVTIGITSFREGDWLRECWESVLAQDDGRWEAVLVQDVGASAESVRIFDEIEHPRLRKHRMERRGWNSGTRNRAFEMSRTPYHFYLDGDDMLLPGSVRLALETFSRRPDAAFVYGDFETFGRDSGTVSFPRAYALEAWAERQVAPGPAVYRRDVWKDAGGFVSDRAQVEALLLNNDYDFHLGIAERGGVGAHCGGVLLRYRVHGKEQISIGAHVGAEVYRTYPLMAARHPRYFADARRRARFLAGGFYESWRAAAGRGEGERAGGVAREALAAVGPAGLLRAGIPGRRLLLAAVLPGAAVRAVSAARRALRG